MCRVKTAMKEKKMKYIWLSRRDGLQTGLRCFFSFYTTDLVHADMTSVRMSVVAHQAQN